MDLVNKIKLFESNQMKPERTTKLKSKHDTDPWKFIQSFYSEDQSSLNNMIASLFNSLLTQNLPCFILSKNILDTIVRRDQNLERKVINSQDYKKLIKFLTEEPTVCKNVVASSTFGVGKKIAGLYRVVDPITRGYFEDIETREQHIVNIYCEYQKIDKITLDKIETI